MIGFIIAGILFIAMFLIWLSHANLVKANSTDLANFEGTYSTAVGSRIDTCSLCHTSSIPSLNAFGAAYKAAGRNPAAFAAIASLDSDGDGYTNAQEIAALTFPGDPNDHPAAPPTATATPGPTNTATTSKTTGPISTMAPTNTPGGPTNTPGAPKPTRTRRPTEVEPTKNEPTNQEHHVTKTPNTNGEPTWTEEVHMTRTPKPTQVCLTPTPGRNHHNNSGSGDWGCGHHGDNRPGQGKDSSDNFFSKAWSSFTRFFHRSSSLVPIFLRFNI